jgi:hypothetical protein
MCGPSENTVSFAPSQAPPAGYEIRCEWGERRDGTVGSGPYYWVKTDDNDQFGEPHATRWEARRDAIKHAKRVNT